MKQKTYAARGLLDWQLALNVGGAIIRIVFSGGHMGANGVIPAKYVTDNPAISRMIEKSEHFRKGRIYLIPGDEEDDIHNIENIDSLRIDSNAKNFGKSTGK